MLHTRDLAVMFGRPLSSQVGSNARHASTNSVVSAFNYLQFLCSHFTVYVLYTAAMSCNGSIRGISHLVQHRITVRHGQPISGPELILTCL